MLQVIRGFARSLYYLDVDVPIVLIFSRIDTTNKLHCMASPARAAVSWVSFRCVTIRLATLSNSAAYCILSQKPDCLQPHTGLE